MTAESIRVERDPLLTRIVASTASATRALKTMIRDLRRSQWFLLVAVVGGAVIALVVIKLLALLAAAFDISFLRDVGNNVGSGGAAGGAAAGAGGAAGGGEPPNSPDPPDPYGPLEGPFPPGEDPNKTPLGDAFDVGFWNGVYLTLIGEGGHEGLYYDRHHWDLTGSAPAGLGKWTSVCGDWSARGETGCPPEVSLWAQSSDGNSN